MDLDDLLDNSSRLGMSSENTIFSHTSLEATTINLPSNDLKQHKF